MAPGTINRAQKSQLAYIVDDYGKLLILPRNYISILMNTRGSCLLSAELDCMVKVTERDRE